MAHAILVPQHLERSDEKHDHNTISKKTGATPDRILLLRKQFMIVLQFSNF